MANSRSKPNRIQHRQHRRDPEIDAGANSLEDAKISGYTDEQGHAISRARRDETESTVGGYTNITSGRSSAVHRRSR